MQVSQCYTRGKAGSRAKANKANQEGMSEELEGVRQEGCEPGESGWGKYRKVQEGNPGARCAFLNQGANIA